MTNPSIRAPIAHLLLIFMAAGLSAAACAESEVPDPYARVSPLQSADFFLAAVSHFAEREDTPMRVEPRPLRAEALLHSVTAADLLLTDSATIRMRTGALAARDIPTADATADWTCVFASGLRPPPGKGNDPIWEEMRAAEPDSLRRHRDACRARGEYVSLAFGPPQAGTQPDHPRRWRIRAMRMLLYGWEVIDLFLEADARGEWQVVEVQERVGAFS
ncbi:MAG TPA: hypothetical protein VF006_03505 [Longimicrobium sp.]